MDYGKVRLDVGHDSVGVITIQNPPVNSLAPDGEAFLAWLAWSWPAYREPSGSASSDAGNASLQQLAVA